MRKDLEQNTVIIAKIFNYAQDAGEIFSGSYDDSIAFINKEFKKYVKEP